MPKKPPKPPYIPPLWDAYTDIEHEMLLAVARLLAETDLADRWQSDPFGAELEIRAELDRIISENWNRASREDLKDAFEKAAKRVLDRDETTYRQAFKKGYLVKEPVPLWESSALESILGGGFLGVEAALKTAGAVASGSIVARLNQAVLGVAGGQATLDEALKAAAGELAAEGIAGFVYPSGARIGLAEYARREIVTGVMNTTRNLAVARAEEWGSDLIQVSAHAGARPGCFPWQGEIYSLSGTSSKYMALSATTYGEPAGLFGKNCRHFFWAWFEGLNDEYTEAEKDPAALLGMDNQEVYELSQEQRYNERQIRSWKRRAAELREAGYDDGRARRKVREWQGRQRAFLETHDEFNRDYRREAA